MALSASALSAAIKTALLADPLTLAVDDALKPPSAKHLTAFCDALAAAVVSHIQAEAIVTFPPGAIAVTGSAAAQANPAPCTGGRVS